MVALPPCPLFSLSPSSSLPPRRGRPPLLPAVSFSLFSVSPLSFFLPCSSSVVLLLSVCLLVFLSCLVWIILAQLDTSATNWLGHHSVFLDLFGCVIFVLILVFFCLAFAVFFLSLPFFPVAFSVCSFSLPLSEPR